MLRRFILDEIYRINVILPMDNSSFKLYLFPKSFAHENIIFEI